MFSMAAFPKLMQLGDEGWALLDIKCDRLVTRELLKVVYRKSRSVGVLASRGAPMPSLEKMEAFLPKYLALGSDILKDEHCNPEEIAERLSDAFNGLRAI